jgi:nucleotide-binding universal stress UspA family protein
LANRLPADLIVLGSHGWSSADHASLTERLIDSCTCPVLTLSEDARIDRFRLCAPAAAAARTPVVVPTDLSAGATRVFDYAVELAGAAPIDLHLLHVMPTSSEPPAVADAHTTLEALVRERSADRITCHVELGSPVETIPRFSDRVDAGFLVMGEHARGLLLRLFIRDVARDVLHRAGCPVWFVPSRG